MTKIVNGKGVCGTRIKPDYGDSVFIESPAENDPLVLNVGQFSSSGIFGFTISSSYMYQDMETKDVFVLSGIHPSEIVFNDYGREIRLKRIR